MFGIYFGKFLVERGFLSPEVYMGLIEATKHDKLKLGLLAIEMGLMTKEQAEEVNRLQQQQDRRFGDIAMSLGYITEDDLYDLLDRQGDSYLLFVQAVLESGLMDFDDIKAQLGEFRKSEHLSAYELESIKTGDVDRILPIFLNDDKLPQTFRDYAALTGRNVVRFVDRFFRIDRPQILSEYKAESMVLQYAHGARNVLVGLGGTENNLDALAWGFVNTLMNNTEAEYDVLDVTAEFLNVNNGLFASGSAGSLRTIRMESPMKKYDGCKLTSKGSIYRIPFYIDECPISLVFCYESETTIE